MPATLLLARIPTQSPPACFCVQAQGVQVAPGVLTQLLGACVAAGTWGLALQLCNAALVAQGGGAAPLFSFTLQQAAAAGKFEAVLDVLTAMRAAGLEVDPAVAAQVGLRQGKHRAGCDAAVSAGRPARLGAAGLL